jgi:hypothetical protein
VYFLQKLEKAVTEFSKAGGRTLPQPTPPVALRLSLDDMQLDSFFFTFSDVLSIR